MSIHHTIDSYSEFQWASASIYLKDNSKIIFLKMMTSLEITLQIEADDASTGISIRIQ